MSLKDFKNEILTEIQSTAYILTSEDENFHQAFQNHFHLRNNSYILYLNHLLSKLYIQNLGDRLVCRQITSISY